MNNLFMGHNNAVVFIVCVYSFSHFLWIVVRFRLAFFLANRWFLRFVGLLVIVAWSQLSVSVVRCLLCIIERNSKITRDFGTTG